MDPFIFLIDTLFDMYLMVVILRFWLQTARADFYNPFCQFVVKITDPLVRPLRRIIPGFGGLDAASIVLALLVSLLGTVLILLIQGSAIPVGPLLMYSAVQVIKEGFNLLFWVMLIRAILSFISQGHNPFEAVLHQLTEPMLAPIRRVVPPIGGLDLSMLVLIIGLQFLMKLAEQVLRTLF